MRLYTAALFLGMALLLTACQAPVAEGPTPVAPTPEPVLSTPQPEPAPQPEPQPPPRTAREWTAEAEALVTAQRWAEAMAAAEQALAADATSSRAWWLLGRAQLGAGEPGAAMRSLREAQARYPDFLPEITFAMGQVHEAAGHMLEAARFYDLVKQNVQGGEPIWQTAPDRLRARFAPAPLPNWSGDLNGDGVSGDRVDLAGHQVRLTLADGSLLHEQSFGEPPLKAWVHPLSEGPPLVQVEQVIWEGGRFRAELTGR